MQPPLGFLLSAALLLGVAMAGSGVVAPVLVFLVGCIALAWVWTLERRILILGAVCLVSILAGITRVHGSQQYPPPPGGLDQSTAFVGVVIDVPSAYPGSTYTRLDLAEPLETRVWGQLPHYPEVAQGDRVSVLGTFIPNDQATFRGFSAQRDTVGVLNAEEVRVEENIATFAQRTRTSVAGSIRERLRTRIPEPAGAFATGVILGDDSAMTESTRHAFRVGGLTHMTAVSGVHVGIVAGVFLFISRMGLVSRWLMLGMSVPFVWSFAFLVGMRPSVVRASLMLTLLLIAHFLGRPRDTLNAVGIAAATMILVEPAFRHDIGFQLSVAATTGIALGILLIGSRSHWHIVWVVPVAAQLATEPLVLYHFGYYSLISPVANILATPFLAVAMGMSIVTVVASLMSATLADIVAIGAWVPSYAVVLIADIAASLPYLSDEVRPISLHGAWSFYIVLGGLVSLLFLHLQVEPNREEGDVSLLYRV